MARTMLPVHSYDLTNGLDVSNLILQSLDQNGDEYTATTSAEDETTTSEVLTFVDSSTGIIDDRQYHMSEIATSSESGNTDLAKFLSRPTLIDTRNWTTSSLIGPLGANIEPWFLFLNNSVISNKLKNYAFLRAKLCVKIVVNATPFHFGLLRAAYEPNVNANNTGDRNSKIRTNPVSNLPYIVPLSQLPGTWIYPADNSGGEIHVPFFRYNNWLPLTSAAAAKTMGAIYFHIVAPLLIASSSGSPSITIDTFAWLEDVQLSGSTTELTLQAKDEYDGVISKAASAVAEVTSHLDKVPYIGKFARATTIGATAMAEVASIFGFTNVPVIDDVHAYVPTPTPHLASSEISTPIQKLSLDPKQELSIDPSMHGLPSDDEMCIKKIIEKPSVLATSGWSTTDPVGTVLFNANVSPMLFSSIEIDDAGTTLRSTRVYHTPMSYVGMMFRQWRGDIIFEFDVICTKFHKGRLKIAWDPLGSGGTAALPENTVYTTILDIGQNNKATIRVPFHQAYEFLHTRGIDRENWTPGNALPSDPKRDNGLLIMSVLTPIMSPVTPQNIVIMISVRAADNLEFANPTSSLGGDQNSQPPSFFAVQGKDVIDIEPDMITFGDDGSKHDHRYGLNIGERIVSLRTVLHRMSIYDTGFSLKTSATKFAQFNKSYTKLPPMYGYDPNGLSTATKILAGVGNANFNFTPTHPITYVAMLYGAFRGSVNYVANASLDLYPYVGDIRVQRIVNGTQASARQGIITSNLSSGATASSTASFFMNNVGPRAFATGGAAFTNSQTNGALAWNYPHMSISNFYYTDPTYSNTGNSVDESNTECTLLQVLLKQQTTQTSTDLLTVTTYAGSGPDFTCLWFLCCPTLDYYATVPAAV